MTLKLTRARDIRPGDVTSPYGTVDATYPTKDDVLIVFHTEDGEIQGSSARVFAPNAEMYAIT